MLFAQVSAPVSAHAFGNFGASFSSGEGLNRTEQTNEKL